MRGATWRAAFAAGALLAGVCAAEVPGAISYQGVLLDPQGQPEVAATSLRFRIFRGGDGTTFPSTGVLVYHEIATVVPVDGVFAHLIGTGAAAADCAGGPCALDAGVFGPGDEPVWIEVVVDPDGIVGSEDDDVLLPRTRVGTVGYAYRVATLDGAAGGVLNGTIVADELVGRAGAVLGDPGASTVDLRFEAAGDPTTVRWDPGKSELGFEDRTRHARGLTLDPDTSLAWGPLDARPIAPHLRIHHWQSLGADGDLDGQPDVQHTLSLCYNCQEASAALEVDTDYAMHAAWDMTASPSPGERRVRHRWSFLAPGRPEFQPFSFEVNPDLAGGFADPRASWAFRTSRTRTALSIHPNGNVLVGSEAFAPEHALDVVGTIHTDNDVVLDAGQAVRFGDAAALGTDASASVLDVGAGFPTVRFPGVVRFESAIELASPTTLLEETVLTSGKGFVQQAASTFPGGQSGGLPGAGVKMRSFPFEPFDAASDAPGSVPGDDTELIWAGPYYNAKPTDLLQRENPADYSLGFQFTAGWTHLSGDRRAEYFWRHVTRDGAATWYPFAWNIVAVDTSAPLLDYTISTSPTRIGLRVCPSSVSVGGPPVGKGDLEIPSGAGTLYVGGSSGGRIKFEGTTNDASQTEVSVRDPTADRFIEFPDASGVVHLNPYSTRIGTLMFGDSDDSADTGDEVCRSVGLTCVHVRTLGGADSICAADQGAAGTLFLAFCRR